MTKKSFEGSREFGSLVHSQGRAGFHAFYIARFKRGRYGRSPFPIGSFYKISCSFCGKMAKIISLRTPFKVGASCLENPKSTSGWGLVLLKNLIKIILI